MLSPKLPDIPVNNYQHKQTTMMRRTITSSSNNPATTMIPITTSAQNRRLPLLMSITNNANYSVPAISLSVCVSVCNLYVCEHISGTAGPIFTKFFVQIHCGRGSVLLWWRCDILCTSGFMDDVTFGHNGLYGDAWKAEPLTYYQ